LRAELERLASACIFPGLDGLTAPDWLRRELADGLGGVTLFSRNVRDREQLARLTAEIRAERDHALIGLDEEGGDVTRLEVETGSSYPGNLALGAMDERSADPPGRRVDRGRARCRRCKSRSCSGRGRQHEST
jgi:beta-N-acetylhexosaminidase